MKTGRSAGGGSVSGKYSVGDPPVPASFFDALQDLAAWLDEAHAPSVVIGGIAASILGRPRATRDVDVLTLLPEDRWEQFLAAGQPFGFEPRLEAILEVHDDLDLERVQRWLREFSAALDKPEILDGFQAIRRRRFQ
jgi:hypothetical protein